MVEIKVVPCPEEQLAVKCPFAMTPTRIVIHNTENDATADQEIAYMHSNPREVSFHFAVDDEHAVQGIALDRNAWHAGDGNGKGNREGIGIEICYSRSGGERFEKAQKNAAALTAQLLRSYGWGIDRVTKHQDYSGKECPRRTMNEIGWDGFLQLVREAYDHSPAEPSGDTAPDITYAAYTKRWWKDVVNYNETDAEGYAGVRGNAITGIRAELSRGHIVYRAHLLSGSYLPWIKDKDAAQAGYAGLYGKAIDGIQAYLEDLPGYAVEYRVSTLGGDYLPWVRNYSDGAEGYAGLYGKSIDRIQFRIIKL